MTEFRHCTVQELFEEQAALQPERIALMHRDEQLTYGALNERANRIAHALRAQGVLPGSLVALYMQRSTDLIAGLLGIVKAGAAYLPLDPEYPAARSEEILADSGAAVLLSHRGLGQQLAFQGRVADLHDPAVCAAEIHNPELRNTPDDLIYVIYTSGSTGRPKGVMIEHRAIAHLKTAIESFLAFSAEETILAMASISFDMSVLETIGALISGLGIVIADEQQQKDPRVLQKLIGQHEVTILQTTPSRMQQLVWANGTLPCSIRQILIGGEAFPPGLLPELRAASQAAIFNMYGPTEATVWATGTLMQDGEPIHIGQPLLNVTAAVVDEQLQPVTPGEAGELCLAGPGLGRGYLNRADLTAEKFVRGVFASGTRLYKTGDLVKQLPDGRLIYLGRVDHQVKIRGYRIELGEVETALLQHADVQEAVVTARTDMAAEHMHLIGYVVAATMPDAAALRAHLKQLVPDYMIPTQYVQLEQLPLNRNGKIDRAALPLPQAETQDSLYDAPETELEATLAGLWQELLGKSRVGVNENFFEIGGNSLLSVKFEVMLEDLDLPSEDLLLFNYNTIRKLADYLEAQLSLS
ncbi:hypothetical protein CBW65_06745 [Tumebacillus avium]|uniref:Carrier domain-containing protein n=1 Tax=Tumebacillus avium TaxID=1903704 RepID=A0A1Y0INA3_9BACL|nr:non-ribosomal peptide synthetase [Tumebacillus avium]ARU60824.1 hypothetical protein CBW65_06745 [Tumebacillus avium]